MAGRAPGLGLKTIPTIVAHPAASLSPFSLFPHVVTGPWALVPRINVARRVEALTGGPCLAARIRLRVPAFAPCR
jgi:hypothetical protein